MEHNKNKSLLTDCLAGGKPRRVGFAYRNGGYAKDLHVSNVSRKKEQKENTISESISQPSHEPVRGGFRIGPDTEIEALFPSLQEERREQEKKLLEQKRIQEQEALEKKRIRQEELEQYRIKRLTIEQQEQAKQEELRRRILAQEEAQRQEALRQEEVRRMTLEQEAIKRKEQEELRRRVLEEEALKRYKLEKQSLEEQEALQRQEEIKKENLRQEKLKRLAIEQQEQAKQEELRRRILAQEEAQRQEALRQEEVRRMTLEQEAIKREEQEELRMKALEEEALKRYETEKQALEEQRESQRQNRIRQEEVQQQEALRQEELRRIALEEEELQRYEAERTALEGQEETIQEELRQEEAREIALEQEAKEKFTREQKEREKQEILSREYDEEEVDERFFTPGLLKDASSYKPKQTPHSEKFSWEGWEKIQDIKDLLGGMYSSLFRRLTPFAAMASILGVVVFGGAFAFRGVALEKHVLGVSNESFGSVLQAVDQMKQLDFAESQAYFSDAGEGFEKASRDLDAWAGALSSAHQSLPLFSKVSSGSHALNAAKELSYAGKEMSLATETLFSLQNPFDSSHKSDTTLLRAFRSFSEHSALARGHISEARKSIDAVNIENIPEEKREMFLLAKTSLPEIEEIMNQYLENAEVFEDMLGANGPRKYLFLFQNPHEARATGGFIGSYGLLDMKDGHIRDFFVDGIFNPDGQLSVDVIPPEPIRKISAGWSLHDSNWFADFPLSAEKAIHFYEKGGGPTVDGVIAITPEVLRQFLEITGDISMEEYDAVITPDNFMETIQYEVEEDYDREENRPKKILNDLAPILIKRIFENARGVGAAEILEVFYRSLAEKHILLYSRDDRIQSLYESSGWSGSLLETEYDYLSVVHSNINGYKTDGVIEESVTHESEIRDDGTILNTVTIERHHTGGGSSYDWYNGVNADYMRVYVPEGSQLISASGHTREQVQDPLDYQALGFLQDEDLKAIEKTLRSDERSGTQIFEESGKTVFGNWVYVSPQETVTVRYTYILPYRFEDVVRGASFSFSSLFQKQSGTEGKMYSYVLRYPESWDILWKDPTLYEEGGKSLQIKEVEQKDVFMGVVFDLAKE